jgi:predicted nucleotidyltransferase
MDRDLAIRILRAHEAELRGMGVRSLALFGSTARGEAHPDSDVDLLTDLDERVGYVELVRIAERWEALLGRPVDLVPRGALRPSLRAQVLAEAEVVLAA